MNIDPLKKRFESFGWAVNEIDGHNMGEIISSLESIPFKKNKPSAIVANTIKGKGVSFMEENKVLWHYRPPIGKDYQNALNELNGIIK